MTLRWLPNALTILRIPLAAAFPFVPEHWRLGVLGAALATEYLDGALARALRVTSRFGRVLDPIADRCLFAAVAITLLLDRSLAPWEMLALGIRDLLFAVAVMVFSARGYAPVMRKMRPRLAGKLVTALQYVALLWLLIAGSMPVAVPAATLALGLFAAAQYLVDFQRLRRSA